eukprot:scaffold564_cov248-Pinguiococcus_pyrenoidosus.AAC.15
MAEKQRLSVQLSRCQEPGSEEHVRQRIGRISRTPGRRAAWSHSCAPKQQSLLPRSNTTLRIPVILISTTASTFLKR